MREAEKYYYRNGTRGHNYYKNLKTGSKGGCRGEKLEINISIKIKIPKHTKKSFPKNNIQQNQQWNLRPLQRKVICNTVMKAL